MSLSTIQAAVIAAVTQVVALLVGFAWITNTEAGAIISCATAVVNAAFVIAVAIENHGKVPPAPAPAPAPTKGVRRAA